MIWKGVKALPTYHGATEQASPTEQSPCRGGNVIELYRSTTANGSLLLLSENGTVNNGIGTQHANNANDNTGHLSPRKMVSWIRSHCCIIKAYCNNFIQKDRVGARRRNMFKRYGMLKLVSTLLTIFMAVWFFTPVGTFGCTGGFVTLRDNPTFPDWLDHKAEWYFKVR